MFEPNSRYAGINAATITLLDHDGKPREICYVRRRLIPHDEGSTTVVEHTVKQGERLDNIAARYLGDPTQFWKICDANNVLSPDELMEEPGRVVKITLLGL